ncbi:MULTISPECIES: hypothetical protein [Asticcacaulis]|uniref:hypothetical protein n=1 Tax=Asticcacaulis TaxID=76890 RepID=UPI001AE2D2E0|nr:MULTISPECIES: hypothetical protein [Asticcacaulis]MBP2160867.1 hypothetical protein [Asticcacaulis solisilvae]MDR6801929.1 hypothetical protein [Asticcacaulis sp. BE141]
MSEDNELKTRLRQWQVPGMAPAAADRMLSGALTLPQVRPWPERLMDELTRGLSDWRYGLGYKLAAGMACLLLGFGMGGVPTDAPVNVAGVALMADAAT